MKICPRLVSGFYRKINAMMVDHWVKIPKIWKVCHGEKLFTQIKQLIRGVQDLFCRPNMKNETRCLKENKIKKEEPKVIW